jgi:protein phosphatase
MAASFEKVEQASLSDVGVRRSHNQDASALLPAPDRTAWMERGHLFLVADGMGAHAVGEMASKMAADLIPHTYQKYANLGPTEALRRAFMEANAGIHQRGKQNREFEGMGTTGTALLLRPEGAWLAHVGDSRAYRIRDGQIEQLTYDHSLHWELARRHQVDPGRIEGIPSNVIVRSLGPEDGVEVDLEGPHPVQPGDIYLLCSDGLSNQVTDPEMGAVVTALPLKEACQFLIDLANLRGGPDNITVVLVKVPGETGPARGPRSNSVFFRNLPWAGVALGAGITLAFLALALVILKQPPALFIATFGVAATTLTAGLVGLYHSVRKTAAWQHNHDHDGPPRVYRQTPCQIDLPLVQKLAQAEATLRELAREKGWTIAWGSHRKHIDLANQLMSQGDLVGTFRELCRAAGLLTEALRRQRNKEERFQPLW